MATISIEYHHGSSYYDDYSKTVSQSGISGKNVAMEARNDITVTGSTIAGEGDVALTAKGQISIESAEAESAHAYQKQVKKSGLLSGGGLGFTIGKEKKKDAYQDTAAEQVGSIVGSIKDNVYTSEESHEYKRSGFSVRYIVSCNHLFVRFSVANPQELWTI